MISIKQYALSIFVKKSDQLKTMQSVIKPRNLIEKYCENNKILKASHLFNFADKNITKRLWHYKKD